MGLQRDLIVESNGHCFLCLNKIPTKIYNGNPEHFSESQPPSIHSIQSLSLYLKMDVEKVFLNEDMSIPANLLTSAEKAELKVELCEGCSILVDRFSKLHSQLEKIQMEVTSSLDRIYKRLKGAEGGASVADIIINSDYGEEWEEKLTILVGLRMDAVQKCYRRIHASSPRVRLHNMTMNGMTREKLKLKKCSSSSTEAKGRRSKQPNPITEKLSESLIAAENLKLEPHNPMSYCEYENDKEYNWNNADLDNDSWENPNDPDTANALAPISTFKVNDTGKPTRPQTTRFQNDKRKKAKRRMSSVDSKDSNFVHTSSLGKGQHKIPQSGLDKKTGMRKCPSCHKLFLTVISFHRHYKILHLQSKFSCNLCDKQFTQKAHWRDHHRGAHLGVKFSCSVCHRQFPYRQSLTRHLRLTPCRRGIAPKLKKETSECIACGKEFGSENKLQRHFKEVHLKIRLFSCGKCGREFSRKENRKQHEISVHGAE